MEFFVICIDRANTAEERACARLAHLEYVHLHRSKFLFGGPLLSDVEEERVGMVCMIDMPTREAAERFIAQEPYTQAGIVETVIIKRIKKVIPEDDPAYLDNLLTNERRRCESGNR